MHMIADHHLELAATLHHHDDARMRFQTLRIGPAVIFKPEAQTRGAMDDAADILFAAHAGENILC